MRGTKVQRWNDECAYVIPEARRCRGISRWVSVTQDTWHDLSSLLKVTRVARDDSENQPTSRAALTLCARSFSFIPSRQGSSVVEQGTHKPLVGSSTLPPGMLDRELLPGLSVWFFV